MLFISSRICEADFGASRACDTKWCSMGATRAAVAIRPTTAEPIERGPIMEAVCTGNNRKLDAELHTDSRMHWEG